MVIKINSRLTFGFPAWPEFCTFYCRAIAIFFFQDDRNQMITTNVWVRQVSDCFTKDTSNLNAPKD